MKAQSKSATTAKSVDIGRYLKVPYHIITAPISPRAREAWLIIAANGSPEKPQVWVRQPTVAKFMRCSTDVVGRAIKELKRHGLIFEAGGLHQGRHKIYVVNWLPPAEQTEDSPTADVRHEHPRESAERPAAQLPNDLPQKCGGSELDILLFDHGEAWGKTFACLDGRSGRPSIRECVEQALNHNGSRACKSVKIYVDTWLRNATVKWLPHYNRELCAPASDPSLSKEAVARKLAEDDARRRRYEQKQREAIPRVTEIVARPAQEKEISAISSDLGDEAREWIVAKIRANLARDARLAEQREREQARFLARGTTPPKPATLFSNADQPICRDNYPLMWDFLRGQWEAAQLKLAA